MALLSLACGGKNKGAESAEDARTRRDTRIVLEKCDTDSKSAEKIDANGDGRPEIVKVMRDSREICRTYDLNFDGKVDRTTFYDEAGKVRRMESDFDRDNRVDEIVLYKGGVEVEKHRATTLDGKLDTWDFLEKGQVVRTERDETGDGVIDQWWEYPTRGCPMIHVDTDGDGRPDPGASIDYCKETGYVPPPLPTAAPVKDPGFGGETGPRLEETENREAAPGEDATGAGDASGEAKGSETQSE